MTTRNTHRYIATLVVAGGLAALAGAPRAEAGLIVAEIEAVNDCPGLFETGHGFGTCVIYPDGNIDIFISPVIAKFEANVDGIVQPLDVEINEDLFSSVVGDEWTFMGGGQSGSFTYTPEGDDPVVRFWVAKTAADFILLHYMVPDELDGDCAGLWTEACLAAALPVTSGTWSTEVLGHNLSHITFYDTGPDITGVVEPATLSLLGLGLLALSRVRRRKPSA